MKAMLRTKKRSKEKYEEKNCFNLRGMGKIEQQYTIY